MALGAGDAEVQQPLLLLREPRGRHVPAGPEPGAARTAQEPLRPELGPGPPEGPPVPNHRAQMEERLQRPGPQMKDRAWSGDSLPGSPCSSATRPGRPQPCPPRRVCTEAAGGGGPCEHACPHVSAIASHSRQDTQALACGMGGSEARDPITRPPAQAGRPCTPAQPCVLRLTAPSWPRGRAGGQIRGARSTAGLRRNERTWPRLPTWPPKCHHLPPGPWGGRASPSGDAVCRLVCRVRKACSVCDLPAGCRTQAPRDLAGPGLWASGGGGPEGRRRKGGAQAPHLAAPGLRGGRGLGPPQGRPGYG